MASEKDEKLASELRKRKREEEDEEEQGRRVKESSFVFSEHSSTVTHDGTQLRNPSTRQKEEPNDRYREDKDERKDDKYRDYREERKSDRDRGHREDKDDRDAYKRDRRDHLRDRDYGRRDDRDRDSRNRRSDREYRDRRDYGRYDRRDDRREDRNRRDDRRDGRPTSQLSAEEKRKLLWGNKKTDPTQLPFSNSFADQEKQKKFMKLMGVKQDEIAVAQQQQTNDLVERSEQVNAELERQYRLGLAYNRPDGKRGLS